jgi:hypothetical protein
MSNSSAASNVQRPVRRSTRVDQAIPITVAGVDSHRGPYSEEVSTSTVSAHGCKYSSKYEVLTDSLVILNLRNGKKDSQAVSARGRVKWTKRPLEKGGLFVTAVELEDPGNIWGLDSPPNDWLPFTGPRKLEMDTSKSKPFSVPRPEPVSAAPDSKSAQVPAPRDARPAAPQQSNPARPVGQLMGDFQQQMESMLAEAAATAVREKTSSMLKDVQANLREEAKRILSDAASAQAGPWIENALNRLKQAGQENAKALHAQWTKKIDADLRQALERIELRQKEFEELSQSLAANSLTRVQEVLDASRKDAVDRIVSRLKEQMAPLLESARKSTVELTKRKEDLEKLLENSVENSSSRIEEACTRIEKQFEMMIRQRIDAAREDLERAGDDASDRALKKLGEATHRHESDAQARLHSALAPVSAAALKDVEEKAAQAARKFAHELAQHSRSHLEFVGGAISELAKGIGKGSKD